MRKQKGLDPSVPSDWYTSMLPDWVLARDLIAGTAAMRAAGRLYLPPHPREPRDAYSERLAQAVLYPGFSQTLEALSAKPFQAPVSVNDDIPYLTLELLDNIDGCGGSFDNLARTWFKEALAKGFAHVLVDAPREGGNPYWLLLEPEQVFAARQEMRNGQATLVHLRFFNYAPVSNGYESTIETTIRELNLTEAGIVAIKVWAQDRRGRWHLKEEFDTSLPAIALSTFYAGTRHGFMCATPPLRDLAHLNVAHWQSDSDQRAIMRIARMPVLAVSGAIGEDDASGENEVVVGPHSFIKLPDPTSRAYYVEHSGAAIQAGRQELLDLEDRMAAFGMHFLRRKSGNVTATARALDEASLMSPLESMALSFKTALELALAHTAHMLGEADRPVPGAGGTVEINTSFAAFDLGETELDALIKARAINDISRLTYLRELKRRGVLADDFDAAIDRSELDAELPGATL